MVGTLVYGKRSCGPWVDVCHLKKGHSDASFDGNSRVDLDDLRQRNASPSTRYWPDLALLELFDSYKVNKARTKHRTGGLLKMRDESTIAVDLVVNSTKYKDDPLLLYARWNHDLKPAHVLEWDSVYRAPVDRSVADNLLKLWT